MIWFTSDLHFGHANIIKYCDRPFSDVGRMDAALISAINARVLYGDTLYVLGDFAKGKSLESVCAYRDRIVCRDVRLVRGNHDKRFADAESPFQEELDYVELTHRAKRICCMHYPMLSWHGMERGSIMLHGHIHAGKAYNLGNRSNGVLRFDAGVDANGYAPVSADEVVRFFEGVEPSGEHHWRGWGGR